MPVLVRVYAYHLAARSLARALVSCSTCTEPPPCLARALLVVEKATVPLYCTGVGWPESVNKKNHDNRIIIISMSQDENESCLAVDSSEVRVTLVCA